MKIGIQSVMGTGLLPPVKMAVKAQELGFATFVDGEHHHMPKATPVPEFYKETGVPEHYKYNYDPLLILAAVTSAAPKLSLGTGILLLPIHDPLILANQITTLDHLTNGRTAFGIGVGWNKPELENHGVEFATRVERTAEMVRAMKLIWSDAYASYNGKYVKFGECWPGPKPIQKPHPPLLYGGRLLKRNIDVAAELFDGWFPTDMYEHTFDSKLEEGLEAFRKAVAAHGRDPKSLRHWYLYAELMVFDHDPVQYSKAAPTRDDLARLERLGIDEAIIGVPPYSEDHFLGAMEHLSKVAQPWLFQN